MVLPHEVRPERVVQCSLGAAICRQSVESGMEKQVSNVADDGENPYDPASTVDTDAVPRRKRKMLFWASSVGLVFAVSLVSGLLVMVDRAREAAARSSCPMANALYGTVLLYSGQPEAAIKQMKHALRAQRLCPPWMVNVISEAFRDLGKVEPSISAVRESVRLDSENLDARAILCTAYTLGGASEDAQQAGRDVIRLKPDFSVEEYAETKPYKDNESVRAIKTSLREAGLP